MEDTKDRKATFAVRLKALRLSRDLTLEHVGENVGVSADTVRRLENGASEPYDRTRYKFIKAYPELADEPDTAEKSA